MHFTLQFVINTWLIRNMWTAKIQAPWQKGLKSDPLDLNKSCIRFWLGDSGLRLISRTKGPLINKKPKTWYWKRALLRSLDGIIRILRLNVRLNDCILNSRIWNSKCPPRPHSLLLRTHHDSDNFPSMFFKKMSAVLTIRASKEMVQIKLTTRFKQWVLFWIDH